MFDTYIIIPHVKSHTNFHRWATDMASRNIAIPTPWQNISLYFHLLLRNKFATTVAVAVQLPPYWQ